MPALIMKKIEDNECRGELWITEFMDTGSADMVDTCVVICSLMVCLNNQSKFELR